MQLQQTRLDLDDARSEIIRLNLEVVRLEHALTSVRNLEALMAFPAPEVIILDLSKDLTPREVEVLQRIMVGESVDAMAHGLYLSRSTVKSHIARIYHKLGVHSRGSAAMAGVRLGLQVPEKEEDEISDSPGSS